MDGDGFSLRWDDDSRNNEVIIPDTDQIAAENLIFLAQDIVGQMSNYSDTAPQFSNDTFAVEQVEIDNTGEMECQITEEVITDDWVQPGGQERVEVPLDQLAPVSVERQNDGNDIDVPLPTDQDEYTAMRPYPCDFCSRRFRKKANLMNHMVAHQNDRPFGCNLCGARYVRRCDFLNHLKTHAFVPEDGEEIIEEVPKQRKSRKRSIQSYTTEKSSTHSDKTAVAARTQQYEGSGSGNSNAISSLRINYECTDPSRPFVCQHCGVGFAREKALASHARVHGGDSPIECNICGELCWSRDNLVSHTLSRHPHKSPQSVTNNDIEPSSEESAADDDEGSESWVELVCKDCGAGFQRADLLQRHVRAAHSYVHPKKENHEVAKSSKEKDTSVTENDNWDNHACSVCGENFRDALDLLAHAESHARSPNDRCVSCGEKFTDRETMIEHISLAHPDLPPNTCLFCGRTFIDDRGLTRHIASQHESPEKMLFCSKCGKSFHNKARLKRHMASHRDKAVLCVVCGESFADGRSLMNHRHSHKGATVRLFPCHECGKTFGSRSSQQIHIRIHTGERPYGCRFCWKAFADGGTLRKHERIHTGEKPYACAICPRAFNQRVVLREHVRSHHSGPDVRHGTAMTPYWCPVCDRLMGTSGELVHHIIQHCDNNTAMKRQPQTGPRKYKRRRPANINDPKMSPIEKKIDEEAVENSSESEASENISKPSIQKKSLKCDSRRRYPQVSAGVKKIVEPEPSAEGSARTKGKMKSKRFVSMPVKPKMIHTERSKPAEGEGAMTRRRTRANVTITSTISTTEERIRPRTKNVSYHDGVERLPAATFPSSSSVKPEPESDITADICAIMNESSETADIDDSIEEEATSSTSVSQERNVKREPSYSETMSESRNIKVEFDDIAVHDNSDSFRCEMCCESFETRQDLLTHVRIHI